VAAGDTRRAGLQRQLGEGEHIDIRAERPHCGGRKAIDPKVPGVDSLDRFAEMDFELGESENKAGFGKECLDRRRHGLCIGKTPARQQTEQRKTQLNQEKVETTHREWPQANGSPSRGES
jgi:hypothetical protein